MAIRILNSREQTKSQLDTMPNPALRQIIELKIKEDGMVVNKDDSALGILNLGNKGEDWATIINFELEDKTVKNEIVDGVTLHDRYIPKLHFKRVVEAEEKSEIVSIEFNGVNFAVPEELTRTAGEYELIYTLQERHLGLNNITHKKEMFVSSVFKGKIEESLYDYYGGATPFDSIVVKNETLKKSSININFNEERKLTIEGNQRLGFEYDSYITDIAVTGFDSQVTSEILFVKEDNIKRVACDENRTWIPYEITNDAGVYDMMVCVYEDNGARFLSDTFKMEVVENFFTDTATPYESTGYSIVVDKDGKIICFGGTQQEAE